MIDEDAAICVLANLGIEHHLTKDALRHYLTGCLDSPENSARIKIHLANCEKCQIELSNEAISTIDVQPNEGFGEQGINGKEKMLATLPALMALLGGRQVHMESLGKFVSPIRIHWMLSSLFEEISRLQEDTSVPKELQAAALSDNTQEKTLQYQKDLSRVFHFVLEIEENLVNRWNEVLLEKRALTALLDDCIAKSPAASEWPTDRLEQIRDYYLQIMLLTSDDQ